MANLVGKVPAIDASGGELAKLHPVATDVWGGWGVQWPDDMTNKPELEQGRAFGYLSTLGRDAPRFARRAVRRDVQIDARENLGWSNAERQLDSAAEELSGDVVFQRTLRQEDLSGLVPDVDFKQGDMLPLVVWGAALEQPCMMIRRRVEDGQPQVEVRFGGSMIVDRTGLAQANAELERQLASDTEALRKAIKDGVSSARSYADSAVAVERAERVSDVDSVRVVLGGAQASEESLVSQLAAVQAQITGMVGDDETPPAPGLLNSYLWMNTRLWEAQDDINRLNREFQAEVRARQREQAVLDARQDAQAQQIALAAPRIASIKEGDNESAENDFFRMYIDGPSAAVAGHWVYVVELKRGWEGSLIVFARSATVPMDVSALRVTARNGLVSERSPLLDGNGVVHYTSAINFRWPREGFSLVAIGVANPPV